MKPTPPEFKRMPQEIYDAGFIEGLGSALRIIRGRLQHWRARRAADFPVGQVEAELLQIEAQLEALGKRGRIA